MTNLISRAFAHISFLLKEFQVKQFFAVVLVGFLVLTTNIAPGRDNADLKERVREKVEQNDAQRPKTVGQWFKDARETEDSPGERLGKIGQQSGEAFKEFGSGYAEGAKETATGTVDKVVETAKDISN